MYEISFSERAKNFLKKLPKNDTEILINKIYSLKEDPFRYLKRLQGYKLWRLRILKYRIIIDVAVSQNKIIILRIGYRKNIYDKI